MSLASKILERTKVEEKKKPLIITLSVRDARKGLEIVKDDPNLKFKQPSSNVLVFGDEDDFDTALSMLKDQKIEIESTNEAMHQNTKVRQLEGSGSRKARLTIKEAKKMVENMLDIKNAAPNPKSDADMVLLKESSYMMDEVMKKLKPVKEVKNKKKMSEAKMDGNVKIVMELLNTMVKGKFNGSVEQLIESFDSEFDTLSEDGVSGEAVAKGLIAVSKALRGVK